MQVEKPYDQKNEKSKAPVVIWSSSRCRGPYHVSPLSCYRRCPHLRLPQWSLSCLMFIDVG